MTKTIQLSAQRRAPRRLRDVLMMTTALMIPPGLALAQAPTCSPSEGGCTVAAGSYSQPYQSQIFNSAPLSFTNNGNFDIQTYSTSTFVGAVESIANGVSGANSSSGDAGSGSPSGNLTFFNYGSVTHSIDALLSGPHVVNSVYGASIGGNGGNYTNDNKKHDGGSAASSGTATLTNTASITVNQLDTANAPGTVVSGAALLVDSIGGSGGNVTSGGPDQNGNPTYGNQNGRAGASGNVATLTNSGAVSVSFGQPMVGTGYWGVAARSLGGPGGTGNDGQPGGNALAADVTNTGNVNVAITWGAPVTFTPGTPMATPGAFAVHARSQGGAGNMSVNSGSNGGSGGNTGTSSVTVGGLGQPLTVSLSTSAASGVTSLPLSAAVGAVSLGGAGGAGYDSSTGGFGGATSTASVTLLDSVTVQAAGTQVMGVLALAQGGSGGNSGVGQNNSRAGDGGSTGYQTDTTYGAQITMTNAVVSTTGSNAPAVAGISRGGVGGTGLNYTQALEPAARGGVGGGGGNTGPVRIDTTGGRISTTGQQSVGILALAMGGTGGNGGNVSAGEGQSGPGGSGGQGAPVTVTVNSGTAITTTGGPATTTSTGTTSLLPPSAAAAFGILASSVGGAGGTGGAVNVDLGAGIGNGGPGGGAYDVTVTLLGGSSVTTSGAGASAVVARSVGGAGGSGSVFSTSGGIATSPANGGAGGNSGAALITSAAQLMTSGNNAHGLVAQSITGSGGDGGNGAGIIYAPSGSGGPSGIAGTATVTNTGAIATAGDGALGIQAQSIGGGSGSAGNVDGSIITVGGSGAAAANGNLATVNHSGSIGTQGQGSIGILVQSIGGGGGNGGDANGVLGSIGGTGTGGGNAEQTTANVNGSVTTLGQLAHGVVAQSIGGGGGNGGNASSAGAVATVAIGGSAGGGGNGGGVALISSGGSINLSGSNAIGMVAQSVGGGGGTGGSAYALSGSLAFAVSHAVGGTGGTGGAGNTVTGTLSGISISTGLATKSNTNLNPVDAHGIVAQSIGGGGGIGGSATAQAFAVGVPVPGSEGNTVAVSIAESVGGSGATGGGAGLVSLSLSGSSPSTNAITTQGQGSHGILLQSIGGGGGAGGDSSAMAATLNYGRALTAAGNYPPPPDAEAPGGPNGFSLAASVAIGGGAQSGGAGGSVTANIDASTVTTLGDYANAVVAQSIGGGGGNGGVGSSTTAALGSTRSVNLSIGVGGTGGTGGNGGEVDGTIGQQAIIQTYGASALGFVAQSIGGGGGTSQGSTVNLGGSYTAGDGVTVSPTADLSVSVGGKGATAGNGGTIRMTMLGQVLTSGSDAAGVVMQSVGGGGGVGGSAGAEASSDNPVSVLTKVRGVFNDLTERNVPAGFTAGLSVGGRGGVAGVGGEISYTQAGSIVTRGDWSHGVVAQSIGGGGGMGGVATSNVSSTNFAASLALGGGGGSGGDGGAVGLSFSAGSGIDTGVAGSSGFAAFGILSQSIGGGGGTAADGSANPTGVVSIGGGVSGSGGAAGNGGPITVSGTTNIVTRGDVGMGLVLQSIGAGGGVGGSGSSLSLSVGNAQYAPSLLVGGQAGSSGNGGTVTINDGNLAIQTSGANAYGILAQSIGGGGGFGFAATQGSQQTFLLGAASLAESGNGNAVNLTLTGGAIQTAGLGSHGIVAQSIGGGGGIAGLVSSSTTDMVFSPSANTIRYAPIGYGGAVTIAAGAPITTTGAFAHGILAQSIGGGGGLAATGGTVFAGTTSTSASSPNSSTTGGGITITQSAPISATGNNSIGIFAQSVGPGGSGVITIDAKSSIEGGAGPYGWGIFVSGTNTGSSIVVEPGASVSAGSGSSIYMQAGGALNQGTITGNIRLDNGTFTNEGVYNAAASVVTQELVNTGDIAIATHVPFGVTNLAGNFTQGANGRLIVDADFTGRRSDVMVVDGAASLDGRVRPRITSVLPNVELPFLVVNGPVTGTMQGEQTTIFSYNVTRRGGVHSFSADADFTPAGYTLSRNAAATAGHLQSAWDTGGGQAGPLFALMGNTADSGGEAAYGAALRQISPNSSLSPSARIAAGARAFASAAMSCPQFEGSTAVLVEGECVWAGQTGRWSAQSGSEGSSGFRIHSNTWQVGGQRSLGGGWFLGGSAAYENARLSTSDRLNSGKAETGFGAVTMKYQSGPWLFAGALFGGRGEFDSSRAITLPGFGSIARGSPSLSNVGAMLRGSYTLGREEFYLRPSMTVSLVHAASGAYRENGAGALDLDVSGASSTVAALTPALEVGGRMTLPNGVAMRLYGSAGVSLLSEGRWTQESRLVSAPAAAGRFASSVRTDQVVGRLAAGMQVFATDRLELRLQYEGEFSSNLTGHGGSLAVAMRF